MLVITRHRIPAQNAGTFLADADAAVAALAQRPGFVDASIARALDDPDLWVITQRWADVGSYRRALGGFEVKVAAVPLLSTATDEPSAFEVLSARLGAVPASAARSASDRASDADTVGIGGAAAPQVANDVGPS